MRPISRDMAALILTLPFAFVPAIWVPLVLWTRQTFVSLNPDYSAHPPTISRAISDPRISGFFANVVLLLNVLICIALVVVAWTYVHSIRKMTIAQSSQIAMYGIVAAFAGSQVVASTGMVVTSEYTFANDGKLHMLGSYVFFSAQMVSILLAAGLCRMLSHRQQQQEMPKQYSHCQRKMRIFRFWFSLGILLLVLLYGVLFIIKNWSLPISPYVVRLAYTQCEVLITICFATFLGSYAVDTYVMVRWGTVVAGQL